MKILRKYAIETKLKKSKNSYDVITRKNGDIMESNSFSTMKNAIEEYKRQIKEYYYDW